MHEVLEAWAGNWLESKAQPWIEYVADPGPLDDIANSRIDRAERERQLGGADVAKALRSQMLGDLEQTRRREQVRAANGWTPVHAEWEFERVEIQTEGGGMLQINGKVDRVDAHADGRLLAVDYKTGKFRKDAARQFFSGRALQLPIYLHAAEQRLGGELSGSSAELAYITERGEFERDAIDGADFAHPGAPYAAPLAHALGVIADGMEHGRFFPYPFREQPKQRPSSFELVCTYCDYQPICTPDVHRRYARKAKTDLKRAPRSSRCTTWNRRDDDRTRPADQAARTRAVEEIGKSVFLEAGAGAGKTRVMVDRIIRTVALSENVQLRDIVAITFTEKAAGELRARIRRALNEELRRAASDDQRDRMHLALDQVDAAHIETIHSFCSSLIRERPFDARIDPYYEVLAELAAGLDFDEAWDEWLWREHDPGTRDALRQMLDWGIELHDLRQAALALERSRDLEIPISRTETADPRAAFAAWRADAAEIAEAYRREGSPDQNDAVDAFIADLDRIADADDDDAVRLARRMAGFAPRPPNKKKRTNTARALWDAAADQREAFADDLKRNALADLLGGLRQFVNEHAERRAASGRLSFDDLLLGARDLIRDHAHARGHFRRRYKTLLIDEFQDTDPLQAELVMLLAAEQSTDNWLDAVPAPGRLFVVGDPSNPSTASAAPTSTSTNASSARSSSPPTAATTRSSNASTSTSAPPRPRRLGQPHVQPHPRPRCRGRARVPGRFRRDPPATATTAAAAWSSSSPRNSTTKSATRAMKKRSSSPR